LNDYPDLIATNTVHKDFFQGSSGEYGFNARNRIFFESNIMKDYFANGHVYGSAKYNTCIANGFASNECSGSDEHFILSRVSGYNDMVIRGNVVANIGSMIFAMELGDRSRMYNNTFVDTNTKVNNSFAVKYLLASENNINTNNLYYKVANTSIGPVQQDDTSTVMSRTNLCYETGTGGNSACIVTNDPNFENYANNRFYLRDSSSAKDSGSEITYAVGAGTDTTRLVVADAGFFTAGFGISGGVAIGDTIRIGNNAPVPITAIDYSSNTITLSKIQTWANNEKIFWRDQDTKPDIGAWEYLPNYTLTGTWTLSNGTVFVTPSNPSLVRFVEVLENGVPVGTDDTPTDGVFSVTGVGLGNVTVKMFSLHASQTPIVEAVLYGTVSRLSEGGRGNDSQGSDGCFIATAAYGSYLDPKVQILREFRDNVMMKNYAGRLFVKFYYKTSPKLAAIIAKNESLRSAVRLNLIPIVYAIEYPYAAGIIILLKLIFIFIVVKKRVSRR
jgi:hypothetical protein